MSGDGKSLCQNMSTVSHPHSDLIDNVLTLYIFVKGCQPLATEEASRLA